MAYAPGSLNSAANAAASEASASNNGHSQTTMGQTFNSLQTLSMPMTISQPATINGMM